MLFLMSFVFALNAQQHVSTEPQKRNVLIEEYTGILCPNCPDGHKIANSITSGYPDNIWAVNIHAGSLANYSVNLKTEDGNEMFNNLDIKGLPGAFINRNSESSLSRDVWASNTVLQMEEDAECNVGGQVYMDLEARTASIDVEVYYTADSKASKNYINVIMLQDDIIAYQSGAADYNPSQMVNGQYRHMHVYRDAISSTWGDEINTTTKGSLFTKEYEYTIPETIGGVTVDIEKVYFIAFVTEQYQGAVTRPVLNVNKLTQFTGSNQDVYVYISGMTATDVMCADEKTLNVSVTNGGLKDITSMVFKYTVDGGEAQEYKWEGNAPSHNISLIKIPVAMTEGEHNVTVEIIKANEETVSSNKTITLINKGWNKVYTLAAEEELTLELVQDKYGYQITWELIDSDYTVIASGGPYDYLSGTSATKENVEKFTVPVGECVRFVIKDSEGNGICCQYGEGYYRILDSKGNVVVEGDGDFGEESSDIISVVEGDAISENTMMDVDIYPNPTNGTLNVNAKAMTKISVVNTLGQVVFDKTVSSDSENIDMSRFEDGIYMVRIMTTEGIVTKRVTVVK